MAGWWQVSAGEVRLTLLGGVAMGLAIAFAPSLARTDRGGAGAVAPQRSEADGPYAQARASREILKGQEGAPAPALVPRAERSGRVTVGAGHQVEVIDGDTFRFAGQTIRIADIDTPELRGRCAYETDLAARATRRMAALLEQGPFELHAIERDTDRYGRKLRVVTRGGRSLGDQLVAEGLARTWSGRREPWC